MTSEEKTGERRGRIVVTGATGFTGGLVARELAAGEEEFLLTGRSRDKLRDLASDVGGAPTAVVDVTEPAALRRVLEPGDVVINCAGPFTELGEGVVRRCVTAGAHYLDTTGEQRFMERIHRLYDDAAREAGVTVVNAMAFEYAPGDAACALALRELSAPPASVQVVYGWQGGTDATSPGTRASVLRVLREPGLAYVRGEWREEPVARRRREVELPDGSRRPAVSFPAGEVVTVPRYADVESVRAWMITGRVTAVAARAAGPLLPPLARLLSPVLEPLLRRGPEGPDREARERSRFTIVAEATGERKPTDGRTPGEERTASEGSVEGVRVVIRGRDPYGLTAALVVAGARRLARAEEASSGEPPGRSEPGEPADRSEPGKPAAGVLAPSQLVPPRALLERLAAHGLEWRLER